MGKFILKGLLLVTGVICILVMAGLGYRAWRQHQTGAQVAINAPRGIDEGLYVTLGGIQQWITIRGQDRSNPVLLVVDGGPGSAGSAFMPNPWEKDFVVVEWDQPGAGRTFGKEGGVIGPDVSMDNIARDGDELADYLRGYLRKNKIGVYAASWGTFIAVPMIQRRPDLFYAYLGTGQEVSFQRGEALVYQDVLAKAQARRDEAAIEELKKAGPPPYRSDTAFHTQRKWAEAYETGPSNASLLSIMLFSPRYSLSDVRNWFGGFLASQEHFYGKAMDGPGTRYDATAYGRDFSVPIFVFQGTQDDYTPFELAKWWVGWIHAPQKALVPAIGAGHYAAASHQAELRTLMRDRVRPLGLAADGVAFRATGRML
jgi:pimeloyl-ACP methyl ester carboxylesterase